MFGKNCRTVLLLLIKEICVLAVSVVPEDSKRSDLPCQRSARDEGFRAFVVLLSGRVFDYILEEQ